MASYHKSAGVIIRDGNSRILMINRALFPYGWACPAGHVKANETNAGGMIREACEEVGIAVTESNLLIHDFIAWNECVKGVRGHDWYVYEAVAWQGSANKNDREVREIKWCRPEELKKLSLEPVWEYWFKKLKFI